jgi:hypothetical protein
MIKTKIALQKTKKSALSKHIIQTHFELSEFANTLEGSANYIVNKTRALSGEKSAYFFRKKTLVAVNGGVDIDKSTPNYKSIHQHIFSEDTGVNEELLLCWFRIGKNRIVYQYETLEELNDCLATVKVLTKFYEIHFKRFKFSLLKTTKKLLYVSLFIGFFVGGFVINVPQKAMAPLTVTSYDKYPQRSKVRGILDFVKSNGSQVTKGELIAKIDTRDLDYDIRESLHKIQEFRIQIEVARKASVTDKKRVSEMELLKISLKRESVVLEKLRYYKSKAEIYASNNGNVRYEESIILQGSHINPGDLVFNIEDDSKKKIEAHLHEEDYGILTSLEKVDYYFYHDPETSVPSEIITVNEEATLTFDNDYAFSVDVELKDQKVPLGTRGYVQFKSSKVCLFYYFFRKAIIVFRGY